MVIERWRSRGDFLLLALAYALGFGGVVLGVPLAALRHGGGAFLVVYAGFVLLLAFPLLVAEFGLGRLAAKSGGGSLSHALEACAPGRGGRYAGALGPALAFLAFGAAVFLAGASLSHAYHAASGDLLGNLPGEMEPFWRGYLDGRSHEHFASRWPLAGFTFGVLAAVVLLLAPGLRGLAWTARLAVPAFLALGLALAARAATLDAAESSFALLWEPDWAALRGTAAWSSAAGHALLTAGLGLAVLPALAARLGPRDDVAGSGYGLGAFFLLFGLLFGGAIAVPMLAGTLGDAAALDAAGRGVPYVAFVAMPQAFQLMEDGEAWAVAWYLFRSLGFLLAALALAQPAAVLLRERGFTRTGALAAFAFGSLLLALLFVFHADDGFLGDAVDLTGGWGVPLLVLAEIAYFAWLLKPRNAASELGDGALLDVPRWFGLWLAVAVPAGVLLASADLYRGFADAAFLRGAGSEGTMAALLARLALLAALLAALLLLRRPVERPSEAPASPPPEVTAHG